METPAAVCAPESPNQLMRYALGVLAAAVAFLVCYALHSWLGSFASFLVFLPAVAYCAAFCGSGPTIVSILLSTAAAKYEFLPPIHSFRPTAAGLPDLLLFLAGSAVIALVGIANRREKIALQTATTDLETRVEDRTIELNRANQNLRELTARLLRLQDEERRRIARELHDSAGQTLSILAMNLSKISAEINRLVSTAGTITDSANLVREMTDDIRTMSYLLHPPFLDERGLASALRWYIDGFVERSKIQVDFQIPEELQRLPEEYETAIFRMVQESLTNIHRHSQSPTAKIRITHSEKDVCVRVEDEGKGISFDKQVEMNSAGTVGVGIRGMRERIHQLGGTLEVHSDGLGKGTVLTAHLSMGIRPLVGEAAHSASAAN